MCLQTPDPLDSCQLDGSLLKHADPIPHYAQRPVPAHTRARHHLQI